MKKIAVFFGGQSVEHDVSIITGVMTANSLNKEKYSVFPVYVDVDGKWYTGEELLDLDGYKNLDIKKLKRVVLFGGDNILYLLKKNKIKALGAISVAINCMHGERGEDGSLSGLLSLCKIPLASPSIMPSAVSMDKRFTKIAMKGIGVSVLPSVFVKNVVDVKEISKKLQFPVIVKPTFLGSSIGIKSARDEKELFSAILYAMKFGDSAIVEPLIEGVTEINCACYMNDNGEILPSECERPIGRSGVLSFDDKYKVGDRVFPADISKGQSEKIKNITKKVYKALGFTGIIRIDYFLVDGKIYLNEINSVPGSLAYYLFSDTLKGFSQMLDSIIRLAEKNYAKGESVQRKFSSGIINGFGSKGAKARVNKK